MGLYPKKLNSLRELRQEKERLRTEREKWSLSYVLTDELSDLTNFIPEKGAGKWINLALSMLDAEAIIGLVTEVIPSFSMDFIAKKIKRSAASIAGTVLGGFLKWEAIELGLRGISLFIRLRKNKQNKNSKTTE